MRFDKDPKEGSNFDLLKVEPGGSVTGIFRGEPVAFFSRWINNKSYPCGEFDDGAKFRFKVNFITKVDDVYKALVWEQGTRSYNMLKDLNEDYPLETTIVKLKREGSGKNTSYSILPIPKGYEVSEDLEVKLSKVLLNDLSVPSGPIVQDQGDDLDSFNQAFPPEMDHEEQLPF